MAKVMVPYYKERVLCEVDDSRFAGVIEPIAYGERTEAQQLQAIHDALDAPIASEKLETLVQGKGRILLITSDHTRPMPSALTMPILLERIRKGAPDAKIKILVATGFHRLTTPEELRERFGEEIASNEDIIVHDARKEADMVYKGIMPSGGELWLNNLVDWADCILSEGFIEPHFFAGFSGGRKSVLPGIASEKTVFFNHNAEFIDDMHARNGILDKNPIHLDMEFAAKEAGLGFILNVCLNDKKQIVHVFAGNPIEAHAIGCAFVRSHARAKKTVADIVVTSNGGYPLDLNIYQSVKCMSGAEPCVREGGVIIAFSSCVDGHGSEGFYELYKKNKTPQAVSRAILERGRDKTMPDQWQAQVLARVQQKATIILVTDQCDKGLVETFALKHAESFVQAMEIAQEIVGEDAGVLFMPNGVEVIAG